MLDSSSWAGNPARAQAEILRHAWFYPTWPLLCMLALSGCVLSAIAVSGWLLFLLLPMIGFTVLYGIHIREFFARGDANPGVVVQVNPTLVAVSTDLRKGSVRYPAIKVVRSKLRRSMGQPLRIGMCLPTVALYYRSPDAKCPYWADFDPRPLECATVDRSTIERVMGSFAAEECQRLETAVHELPVVAPGLYMRSEHRWEWVPGFSMRDVLLSTLVARLRL